MKLILLALLFLSTAAEAHILGIDYSAFTVSKIMCNRDYLVPELDCKDWRGGAALDADFGTTPKYDYRLLFRNTIHAEGNEARFQTVGWQYEALISATNLGLEIGWAHHSRHSMDQSTPNVYSQDWETLVHNKFPIYDAIFLRFVLYRR